MMPALVAQFVTLLKDTSLTAVIGILELTRRGQIVFAQPLFQPIPVFALIALVYFTANFGLAQIGRPPRSTHPLTAQPFRMRS